MRRGERLCTQIMYAVTFAAVARAVKRRSRAASHRTKSIPVGRGKRTAAHAHQSGAVRHIYSRVVPHARLCTRGNMHMFTAAQRYTPRQPFAYTFGELVRRFIIRSSAFKATGKQCGAHGRFVKSIRLYKRVCSHQIRSYGF